MAGWIETGNHLGFQSTRPVWGATSAARWRTWKPSCFNPRAPCGARPEIVAELPGWNCFNPRAPCGARRGNPAHSISMVVVSIHAPRVGRDLTFDENRAAYKGFNPRAPCGARRFIGSASLTETVFQSTRPVWGATRQFKTSRLKTLFQSTRPVWGATNQARKRGRARGFQSTRPVWGATWPVGSRPAITWGFQSTRPVWGATPFTVCVGIEHMSFNPRAPCGARLLFAVDSGARPEFQSTRPVWGAT